MAFENDKLVREFEQTLRRHLKRAGNRASVCAGFDPDTTSAYLEHTLSGASRARYEEHLAGCPSCRRHVVELFRVMPPSAAAVAAVSHSGARLSFFSRWFDSPAWRWGLVTAAGACAVLFIVFMAQVNRRQADSVALIASKQEQMARASSPQPSASPAVELAKNAEAPLSAASSAGEKAKAKTDAHATTTSQTSSVGDIQQAGKAAPSAQSAPGVARRALALDGADQNTIAGTVSDQRGAVISQAEVTLIDSTSQQTRATIRTDNQGRFGFNNVPAGNYLVQAQAPGFRTQQVPAETQELPRQAANQLNLKLEAGAATETVQVEADKKAEQLERNQQGQQQGQVVAVPKRPYIPPSEPRLVAGPRLPEKKVDDKKPADEAREAVNEARAAKQGERSDAAPRTRVASRDAEAKSKDQKLASKEAPTAAAGREEAKSGEAGRARRNQESDAAGARPPAAAPAPSSRTAPAKTSSPPTKQIGAKTFRLESSVWVDSQYKPEDKLPVIQLIIGSDEFKRTLAATPALKPFFDLGQVTVVWQGKVYQVRAK